MGPAAAASLAALCLCRLVVCVPTGTSNAASTQVSTAHLLLVLAALDRTHVSEIDTLNRKQRDFLKDLMNH